MWFIMAVLFLMGSAITIERIDDHILPDITRWAWWTMNLLACGLAALYAAYSQFWQKAVGWLAVTLFYVQYPVLWDWHIAMVPQQPDGFPWGIIYIIANVVIPLLLVTVGVMRPVVRGG